MRKIARGRREAKGMGAEGGHYSIKRPQGGVESLLTTAPSGQGSLAGGGWMKQEAAAATTQLSLNMGLSPQ